MNDNKKLRLGDGKQKKSYLYIEDYVDAILFTINKANDKINIFNLGTNEYVQVIDSINVICKQLEINPKLIFSGGKRGWVGDNPFIFLDCSKIRKLGWEPKLSINDAVSRTLSYLESNQWLLDNRN